jgi:hypothetical protein
VSLPLSPSSVAVLEARHVLYDACVPLAAIAHKHAGIRLRTAMLVTRYADRDPALLQEAVDAFAGVDILLPRNAAGAVMVLRDNLIEWFRASADEAARLLVREAIRQGLVSAWGVRGAVRVELLPEMFDLGTVDLEQNRLLFDGAIWHDVVLQRGSAGAVPGIYTPPASDTDKERFRKVVHTEIRSPKSGIHVTKETGEKAVGQSIRLLVHTPRRVVWRKIVAACKAADIKVPLTESTFKRYTAEGQQNWLMQPYNSHVLVFVADRVTRRS